MGSSVEEARAGLRTVTRGTLLMMIGTIGFVAESFVTRVLLFRTLDAYLYSQLALAIPLAGLASAVGSLGLGPAVARTLPFESTTPERRRIVYTAFIVGGPAALGAGAALALLSLPISVTYHAPAFALALDFLAVSTAISIFAGIIAAVFQGFEDVVPNALFNQVLNPLLFIVFLVTAERATPNSSHYYDALVGYVVAAVLSLAALLVYFRRNLPTHLPTGPASSEVSRKLLWFAAPLFLVGVLSYVSGNGDILILGAHNRSLVGTYSIELTLARLLQVGIASLGYIFLPVTTRFVRLGDRTSVRTIFATATKWMVLVSLPLFLLFFFLPSESLVFVYGAGASTATRPLQILLLGSFASTLVGPAFAAQVAYGQTRLLFYNTLVSAAVNVGLAAALIPTYGLTGAAIAWAASSALFPGLSLAEIAVLEGIHPFGRSFTSPLLATGVPAGVVLALLPPLPTQWLLPVIGLGVAGHFLLAVVLTGSIDDGDRLLLEVVEGILGRPVPFVRRIAAFSRRLSPGRRG